MKYKLVPVEPTAEQIGVLSDVMYADYDENYVNLDSIIDTYRTLIAAPSPEWVKVSERLPTRDAADEGKCVWWSDTVAVWFGPWSDYDERSGLYWLPKPRQQPPAPPTEVEID